MKKILIMVSCIFILCGCQNVSDLKTDEIINKFNKDVEKSNVYRLGYKYNLPSRMQIDDSGNFTEVISNDDCVFYLYVDVVSYYNKIGNVYTENKEAFYSKKYEINGKISYLEINNVKNDKYLIEIMYNYAKIEVMVDYADINVALIDSIKILNNIVYNDLIIENYLGDDVLNFSEEIYDIFSIDDSTDSGYIK